MHKRQTSRRTLLAVAAAAGSLLCAAEFVRGINIVLSYNAGASAEPAGDPTGASLTAIMQHIESVYQDIFEDTHTLTINYWYEELSVSQSPSTLAVHSLVSQSGGRETVANIRFDPDATGNNWFWDPTPADNSEFNMSQTLWRDLSGAQQTDLYNFAGTIPATFEVGYTGANNGSNANVAGRTDLLSVAFHEVGHALGMSAANTSTQTETGDNDYDFDSVNVFGATLAAEVGDGPNIAHLDGSGFALMVPNIPAALRRLPSHTDLFSMAAVHNYVNLDVPRREFYGGSNWNTDGNWSGNTIPGSADEVFVRNPGSLVTMSLSANAFAGSLFVGEGAWVTTSGFNLSAGEATIDGAGSGASTRIRVSSGGTLSSSNVTVTNDGILTMSGGQANVTNLTTTATGFIDGNGTLNVSTISNSGTINANGLLTITGSGTLNLDGGIVLPFLAEPGTINAIGADSAIVVNGNVEPFNGVINIGNSNSITFNTPWNLAGSGSTGSIIILGSDGVLNLNGGTNSTSSANLNGATVTVAGDINVGTANYGRINAPVVFQNSPGGGAEVVVNGTLNLANTVIFGGGSYTGAGRLILDGLSITVAADTTINVATLDWDGLFTNGTFTVNDGVSATINSTITDSFTERLNVFGSLFVNSDWSTDAVGHINLNTGTIGGSGNLTVGGDVTVFNGISTFSSNVHFSSATVLGGSGVSALYLSGNTTFSGGSYSGVGTLIFEGVTQTFAANTTIDIANLDMDGGTTNNIITVNPGVTANINSSLNNDAFNSMININSGTMNLNVGVPWILAGDLNMTDTGGGDPVLGGQPVRVNGGTINSGGGGLIFGGLTFDAAQVNVTSDTLSVAGPFASGTNGTLLKTGAGTLVINGSQSHANNAQLTVNGGTVSLNTDAGPVSQVLRIVAATGGAVQFGATQHIQSLNVQNDARAYISGGPDKVVDVRQLNIAGSGFVDIADNDMIIDYSGGASPLLTIRGHIISGYAAGAWNGAGIHSSDAAAGSNTGIGYADNAALGLATFAGEPVALTSVLVKYTYYGDADLDGDVDGVDVGLWASNFTGELGGAGSSLWNQGDWDYDGDVDGIDVGLWAQNFTGELGGAGLSELVVTWPGNPEAAALLQGLGVTLVPEPAGLALLGSALATLLARRRR